MDEGWSWKPANTVINCPGTGKDTSSIIDPRMIQDLSTGQIYVLIDHFPGGIGQPNCWASTGLGERGRRQLRDLNDERYVVEPDDAATMIEGQSTELRVLGDGTVLHDGGPADNIELAPGVDPAETLLAILTSYLQIAYSDDDGLTWNRPRDLNPELKQQRIGSLGTYPSNGIALRSGPHIGCLIVPLYFNNDQDWLAMYAMVAYSNDRSETRQLGHGPNKGRQTPQGEFDPQTFVDETWSLHKAAVAERQDGMLVLFMRNQYLRGRVAISESHDAGQIRGPVRFDEALPGIWCQPNAISLPSPEGEDHVVSANASLMLPSRGYGVIRLSFDGRCSWKHSRTFNPEHYVYQCMRVLPDDRIGILWENECQGLYSSYLPLGQFFDGPETIDPHQAESQDSQS